MSMDDHSEFVHDWGDNAIQLRAHLNAGRQALVTGAIESYYRETHPGQPIDPVAVRAVWHRLLTDWHAYPTIQHAAHEWKQPSPTPPPPGDLAPLIIGHWKGNFLHRSFFGPAIAARSPEERRAYFAQQAALGYTHVLINPHQDDWGPRVGHPEWTAGGYWGYDKPEHFRGVLVEARQAGLSPVSGVVDRGQDGDVGSVIGRCKFAVSHWGEHVAGWWPIWEADEVFATSTLYEDGMARIIGEVDWQGKDVGIHNADGLKGGFGYFGRLGQIYPGHVVRWQQFHAHLTLNQLVRESRLTAEVAADTDTKVCAAEHSAEFNQMPTYTEAEAAQRARACLDVMLEHLSADRTGSLNG